MEKPVTLILGLGQLTGEAVARRFCDAGHSVLACDPQMKRVERVADTLRDRAIVQHEELHTKIGLKNCIAAAVEAYGKVDHIVSVPPLAPDMPLDGLDVEAFEKLQMRALRGAILTLQLFDKHIARRVEEAGDTMGRRAQLGSVTFVLSLSARQVNEGDFADSVVQNSILGVVRAGAVELAPKRIRTNAICALRPRAESTEVKWLKKRTPLGRASLGDEIAETALFLSQPSSAIITGETIVMDGGRSNLSGIIETDD
ncbi:SDR family oxidoreductase [Henriciella aquimarina]|uniref:SDR family oxidoreductase n=1 Tax=Henriciella aquimarina TaxID=545261 RepID=UPI000A04DA5A|nr:SDR family oxidoreductase [Henriciella aquimarina]